MSWFLVLMSTPRKWMGLLSGSSWHCAKDRCLDGAVVAHDGINPVDKSGSAHGYGSVCFWNLAYLANSILLDQRLQEFCAVGTTTLEPVILGFCWPSVWGHHHVRRIL
jgi:hypothetical protein